MRTSGVDPWELMCVTFFPGATELLGFTLGKKGGLRRLCSLISRLGADLRRKVYLSMCGMTKTFSLREAEQIILNEKRASGLARRSGKCAAVVCGAVGNNAGGGKQSQKRKRDGEGDAKQTPHTRVSMDKMHPEAPSQKGVAAPGGRAGGALTLAVWEVLAQRSLKEGAHQCNI